MTFQEPMLLIAAVCAALLLLGAERVRLHRARSVLQTFSRLHFRLSDPVPRVRARLHSLGLPLAAFLLLAGLAGPRVGKERLPRGGLDILFVLDCSRSMAAPSGREGSRLEAAVSTIEAETRRLGRRDRVGLVLFAGEAVVASPLTRDRAGFSFFLEQVTPWDVPGRGSAPGAGIERACALLKRRAAGARSGVVVLLSDGERKGEETEAALRAARRAGAAGVKVCTVSFGAHEGAALPLPGGGFLEEGGRPVVSRPDPGFLARVAVSGEGIFSDAWKTDRPLSFLDSGAVARRGPRDLSFPCFYGAALLLVLELLLPSVFRKKGRRAFGGAAWRAAAVFLSCVVLPGAAHAPRTDPARRGVELFRSGDYEGALARFEEARRGAPKDPRIAVNLGLCRLLLHQPARAGERFEEALSAPLPSVARAARFGAGLAAYEQARKFLQEARNAAGSERRRLLARALFLARSARSFFAACLKEGAWTEAGAVNLELSNRLAADLEGAVRRSAGRGKGADRAQGETGGEGLSSAASTGATAQRGTGEGSVFGEESRREKEGVAAAALPSAPEKERIYALLDLLRGKRADLLRARKNAWLRDPEAENR